MNSSIILFEDLLKSSSFSDLLGDEVLSTLRCAVCMDYFKEPTILVCGHTFCYGCLYDMSMHMKSRMMNVHIRNVRIHCPNCRIPVHVQGIIQRRCTTNFSLASFVESLEDVKVPIKTFSESSTNTETKEEETNNDTSYEYDETSLNKMDAEIDNAISVLRGDADVIHDAWREIHNLREVVNRSAEDSESRLQNTSRKDAPFTDKDNKTSGVRGDESSRGQIYSLQSQDPAILMSSADVTH